MSKFTEYIGSQFGNPRGIIGKCCCLLMNSINRSMYRSVATSFTLNEKYKVLDIGYGNGYLIEQIYKKYKPDIFGIDISEDMMKIATKRNHKAVENGKIKLRVGDCCELDFENNKFNVVTSINTIYFWNDTLKGLYEIYRILKKDGVFYNVVYSKEWLEKLSYTEKGFKLFNKDEFVALGEKVGFSNISIKQISKGKSYIVQYRK